MWPFIHSFTGTPLQHQYWSSTTVPVKSNIQSDYYPETIRNAMRIQGSGVSLYAPSRWQKYTIKLYNLLKITPAFGSWNFYLIIIYHFLVILMCIEFVFKIVYWWSVHHLAVLADYSINLLSVVWKKCFLMCRKFPTDNFRKFPEIYSNLSGKLLTFVNYLSQSQLFQSPTLKVMLS